MTTDQSVDMAFIALTAKISRDRGFRCASYKDKCLRRRIAVRMRAHGVHTYGDYARVLDAVPHEYDLLIDALTINVTKLFRNWETFAAIEKSVAPVLFARDETRLRVWSAGCASGEEAYSLAILFHRYALEPKARGACARRRYRHRSGESRRRRAGRLRRGGVRRHPGGAAAALLLAALAPRRRAGGPRDGALQAP